MPVLIFLFVLITVSLNAQTPIRSSFTIGDFLVWDSPLLKEQRQLNIYLPLTYHQDTARRYPIIYLLDGSLDEDIIHVAGIVQFGSFSWVDFVPESIVVGISNVDRKRDYTYPTRNETDKKIYPTTGGSAAFIQFLEQEVKPIVEERYRINDSTETLIGQSLGGLLATEILLKKPHLFDQYIILSPSLWWDAQSLLELPLPESLPEKSIYIGVGKEGKVMERNSRALYRWFKTSKTPPRQLYFGYFPKQNHGDMLHLSVYEAFNRLFGKEE